MAFPLIIGRTKMRNRNETASVPCWRGDRGTVILMPRLTLAAYPDEAWRVHRLEIRDPKLRAAVLDLQLKASDLEDANDRLQNEIEDLQEDLRRVVDGVA